MALRGLHKLYAAVFIGGGIEVLWYVWSEARRRRILQSVISPQVRRGCAGFTHKPLSFVVAVRVAVAVWRMWMRLSTGAAVYSVGMRKGARGNIWVWRPRQRLGDAGRRSMLAPATEHAAPDYASSEDASDDASSATDCILEDEVDISPSPSALTLSDDASSAPGRGARGGGGGAAGAGGAAAKDRQASPRHLQPPLVVFPGAGFGAVQYARVLQSVCDKLQTSVACLEDPSTFAGHHLSTSAPLTARGWVRLYLEACNIVLIQHPNNSASSTKNAVDMWSHSNGSFMAALACNTAPVPPRRALFDEPTALKEDWGPGYVKGGKSLLQRFTTWLVAHDECTVKYLFACQDPARPDGLARHNSMLTMPLRPGVQYTVDTADQDHMFNTTKARQLIPLSHHARIRWRSHPGGHGDSVTLCDEPTAHAAAAAVSAQLARPWASTRVHM